MSGVITVRLNPNLHRAFSYLSKKKMVSMNSLATALVKQVVLQDEDAYAVYSGEEPPQPGKTTPSIDLHLAVRSIQDDEGKIS